MYNGTYVRSEKGLKVLIFKKIRRGENPRWWHG